MDLLYSVAKPVLFRMDAENAHHLALKALTTVSSLGLLKSVGFGSKPVSLAGLKFPNVIGLAAGFDKNADYIDALGLLGFGHIEVGTVTPRPQVGNPRPRLFRLASKHAIINRMGFNNKGVDHLVGNMKRARFNGVRGINIGKNFDTELKDAHKDYLICFDKVYEFADYIVVNVSSPNTEGLRSLQGSEELTKILEPLLESRAAKVGQGLTSKPLFVKVAPDLSSEQVEVIANTLKTLVIDGLIATNTTIGREGVEGQKFSGEKGGLSGAPLHGKSCDVISQFRGHLGSEYPIIGVGGIMDESTAKLSLEAGANLLQLYSGFIYGGPKLVRKLRELN